MAIMLRNVHGAAKKVKEVSLKTLTYAGAAKGKGKRQRRSERSSARMSARQR